MEDAGIDLKANVPYTPYKLDLLSCRLCLLLRDYFHGELSLAADDEVVLKIAWKCQDALLYVYSRSQMSRSMFELKSPLMLCFQRI